jgi:PPOX class probable F420-dependent enzyme
MAVATIGADGRPHVVAMWYAFFNGLPSFWTYEKSQKVVNLRRDPRITCMVEAGKTYGELRGVELVARGRIITDADEVVRFGVIEAERYQGARVTDSVLPAIQRSAAKRVVIQIDAEKVVSWDHRKLSGTY